MNGDVALAKHPCRLPRPRRSGNRFVARRALGEEGARGTIEEPMGAAGFDRLREPIFIWFSLAIQITYLNIEI
jgi:hypothetical protein